MGIVIGVLVVTGLALIVLGVLGHQPLPASIPKQSIGFTAIVGGVVVGAALFLVTGWLVLGLAGFAAGVTAQVLWRSSGESVAVYADRTEAIAGWFETINGRITAGQPLTSSIVFAANQASVGPISEPMKRFVATVNAGLSIDRAMKDLADDLEHGIATSGIFILRRAMDSSGAAISAAVAAQAESARERVASLVRIEAERAKARTTVRTAVGLITGFTFVVIVWFRAFLEPYSSVGGQIILAVCLAVMAGLLYWVWSAGKLQDMPDPMRGNQ